MNYTAIRFVPLLVAGACLLTGPAHADSIVLNNGHVLEGIIERETDKMIYLNIGVGSASFRKSQVSEIIRSENQDRLRNHWKEENFYRPEYVPQGYEALAEQFRNLLDSRIAAQKASLKVEAYQRMRGESASVVKRLEDKRAALNKKLEEGEVTLPAEEFKRLTEQVEQLTSQLAEATEEQAGHAGSVDTEANVIDAYKSKRSSMISAHSKAAEENASKDAEEFLQLMATRLDEFKNDFSGVRTPRKAAPPVGATAVRTSPRNAPSTSPAQPGNRPGGIPAGGPPIGGLPVGGPPGGLPPGLTPGPGQ